MKVVIRPAGLVEALYDDCLDWAALGLPQIRRASQVDADSSAHWYANLGPVDGPVLGPFATRREALAAEATWLEDNLLLGAQTRQ